MQDTNVKSKLFLLSGALCSGFAFMLAFLLDTPVNEDFIGKLNSKQAAAVATTDTNGYKKISASEFASISVLSSEDVIRKTGHISTDKEIIADLDSKNITVLEGTNVIAEFPILSIGRPGTFWETPAGDYSVKTKEIKHLSSIGGTWMPYSMQFYGNFFIHGWPTYKDGSDVPAGYSGGCIRLSTNDAKKLYSLVDLGTHIHVRGTNIKENVNDSKFYMKSVGDLPEIKAKSFMVFDVETEKVLWSNNSDEIISPKKLTSLLTALISVETIDQYKYLNFEALISGKNPGNARSSDPSSIQVGALLYPLLFDQSDIAAKAIVELRGKNVFKNYMNEKSLAIGMSSTSWGGGLSSDNSSTTVRDLSRLLAYVGKQKSYLLSTTLADSRSFEYDGDVRFSWKNKNDWVKDGTFMGGVMSKGLGSSGSAMAIYSIQTNEFSTRKIGIVVADAENLNDEIKKIKDYFSEHFFYGTRAQIEEKYNGYSDLDSKVEQMKLIKEQLIK